MVFSSIIFLFYFLPLVLIGYHCFPPRLRNGFLLAASLMFYAFGEPRNVAVLCVSILLNYVLGLQIAKREGTARKGWMIGAVSLNLAVLFVFKYAGFFLSSVCALTGLPFSAPALSLPLGISFYTFQIISYLVDVYRGETPAQRNLTKLALYASMFPQLVAGPIVRYSSLAEQMDRSLCSVPMAASGVQRFILGLSKKVLLANPCGVVADHAFSQTAQSLTTGTAWLGALAYTLQIYFDFSAYSDMAIGLGGMLGFRFPENFDHPYLAKSVTEFWRRWHISLSSWFRDYVYIPLGGSRRTALRNFGNLMLVWLLTGLWHGAAWNFILWGVYYGVLLAAERALRRRGVHVPAVLGHVGTMLAVVLGWVLFRAGSLSQVFFYLRAMFWGKGRLWDAYTLLYLHDTWLLMAAGVLACTPLPHRLLSALGRRERLLPQLCCWGILFLLFGFCILCLVNAAYNPFIYFRF